MSDEILAEAWDITAVPVIFMQRQRNCGKNSAGSFPQLFRCTYPERDRGNIRRQLLLVCLEIALCCRGWECLPGIGPDFSVSILSTVTQGRKCFSRLAAELLDRQHPDPLQSGDYGFRRPYNVRRKSPFVYIVRCGKIIVALASGQVEKLPVKAGKAVVKPRYFNYLHIHCRV